MASRHRAVRALFLLRQPDTALAHLPRRASPASSSFSIISGPPPRQQRCAAKGAERAGSLTPGYPCGRGSPAGAAAPAAAVILRSDERVSAPHAAQRHHAVFRIRAKQAIARLQWRAAFTQYHTGAPQHEPAALNVARHKLHRRCGPAPYLCSSLRRREVQRPRQQPASAPSPAAGASPADSCRSVKSGFVGGHGPTPPTRRKVLYPARYAPEWRVSGTSV